MAVRSRHPEERDYAPLIAVLDYWWGDTRMSATLPRLWFLHFGPTSFLVEDDGERVGFLVGFVSQTDPTRAFIHLVGVAPGTRGQGIGRFLHEKFFDTVREMGCTEVECVTTPANRASVAFYTRLGFAIVPGDAEESGFSVHRHYDGPGETRVLLHRTMDARPAL